MKATALFSVALVSAAALNVATWGDFVKVTFGLEPPPLAQREAMFSVKKLELSRDGRLVLEREVHVEGAARYYLTVESEHGRVICAGGGRATFTKSETKRKEWIMRDLVNDCPETFAAGDILIGDWVPLDKDLGVRSKTAVVK